MQDDSTTREEWRPVAGFDGSYEVSSFGRVRSLSRMVEYERDGLALRRMARGRLLSQSSAGSGYRKVSLGAGKRRLVHLLVIEAFHGPRVDGAWCRHLNGDPSDNRPENLAWGTPKENGADTVRHGRSTKGEHNPMSKLTADDVREIRRLREGGMMLKEIGARFGIAESTVCRIAKRVEWSHVE